MLAKRRMVSSFRRGTMIFFPKSGGHHAAAELEAHHADQRGLPHPGREAHGGGADQRGAGAHHGGLAAHHEGGLQTSAAGGVDRCLGADRPAKSIRQGGPPLPVEHAGTRRSATRMHRDDQDALPGHHGQHAHQRLDGRHGAHAQRHPAGMPAQPAAACARAGPRPAAPAESRGCRACASRETRAAEAEA